MVILGPKPQIFDNFMVSISQSIYFDGQKYNECLLGDLAKERLASLTRPSLIMIIPNDKICSDPQKLLVFALMK